MIHDRATTFVGGDVGSIPTCCALEVWQWTFGSRTVWLVNKSAGQLQFSLWASLRGQYPESELRLPPCRNYTRACSRS